MGATTAVFEVGQVAELGRYSERWRFDYPHLARPREHAFGVAIADDPQEAAAAAWASNEARGPEGLRPIRVVQPKSHEQIFKTVPFSVVDRDWKVCGRHRWARPEPIPVLEARASLFAVSRHALRSGRTFGKRVLILSDSISAVCALDRGRGQSFKMRRVSQQVAALSLGGNVQLAFRWVPFEWNPADGPSRGSIFPSKPSLMPHGIEHDPPISSGGKAVPQEGKQEEAPRGLPIGSSEQCDRGKEETTGEEEGTVAIGWTSGRSVCDREEPGDIPGLLGQVDQLHLRAAGRALPAVLGRFVPGRNAEPHVRRGRGPQQGSIHVGGSPVSSASPQVEQTSDVAKIETVAAGVEKARSSEVAAPAAVGSGVLDDQVCNDSQLPAGGAHDGNVLRLLYLRPGEVSRLRCRDLVPPVRNAKKTARTWSVVLHPVELEVASKTAEFDETVTFDDLETQYIPEAVSKRMKSLHSRKTPNAIHKQFNTAQTSDGRDGKSGAPTGNRSTSPIQASTRGGEQRLRSPKTEAGRDSEEGPLEELCIGPPVRERRAPQSNAARAGSQGARQVSAGRGQHRAHSPVEALNPGRSLAVAVFLEIFSGCGNLSKAVLVLMWDITMGTEYDLRPRSKRRVIGDWLRSGLLLGFHLGTPCESFTRAREIPPGPPPLRSDSRPLV